MACRQFEKIKRKNKMKILIYFIILFIFFSNSVQLNEWILFYENSLEENRVFLNI